MSMSINSDPYIIHNLQRTNVKVSEIQNVIAIIIARIFINLLECGFYTQNQLNDKGGYHAPSKSYAIFLALHVAERV